MWTSITKFNIAVPQFLVRHYIDDVILQFTLRPLYSCGRLMCGSGLHYVLCKGADQILFNLKRK